MQKNKLLGVFYVILILFTNLELISYNSLANPLPLPYEYALGGILHKNNNSLNLLNANVRFEIDCTDFLNNISLLFDGNYTIYNPTNNEINTTIFAPFDFRLRSNESDWQVEVNGTAKEFNLISPYSLDLETWDYLNNYTDDLVYFIVINASIPANSSQIIRYSFTISFENPLYRTSYYSIRYTLSTSKAWNNNITEDVKFIVSGKLPNYYTDDTEKECVLESLPNGRIYSWNWNDEIIEDDFVGITYSGRLLRPGEIILYVILIIIGSGTGIFLTIFFISRKRKKRRL